MNESEKVVRGQTPLSSQKLAAPALPHRLLCPGGALDKASGRLVVDTPPSADIAVLSPEQLTFGRLRPYFLPFTFQPKSFIRVSSTSVIFLWKLPGMKELCMRMLFLSTCVTLEPPLNTGGL